MDPHNKLSNEEKQKRLKLIEEQYNKKLEALERTGRNSFILQNNQKENEDGSFAKKIMEINESSRERRIVNEKSVISKEHFIFTIKRHPEIVSSFLIETNALFISYPFNTIKTRIQCLHHKEDVAYFLRNKVAKISLYNGFSQQYAIATISSMIFFPIMKTFDYFIENSENYKDLPGIQKTIIAYSLTDFILCFFKIPFEVKKIFLQLNYTKFTFQERINSSFKTIIPFVLRDLSYRSVFLGFHYFYILREQLRFKKQSEFLPPEEVNRNYVSDKVRIFNSLFLSTLVATLISNPFDVIATKLISQRVPKYRNFFDTTITVIKEESAKKLLSGYWSRSVFHLLQGIAIYHFFEPLTKKTREGFKSLKF